MEENKDYMQQPEGTVGAENSLAGDGVQERQENAPYRQRRRINNAERITPSPHSYQSDRDDFNRPYRRYNNYEDSHYQRAPRPDRPYSEQRDAYSNDSQNSNKWGNVNTHNRYVNNRPNYHGYNSNYNRDNERYPNPSYEQGQRPDEYRGFNTQPRYYQRQRHNYDSRMNRDPYSSYENNRGDVESSPYNNRNYNNSYQSDGNYNNHGYRQNGFQSRREGFRPQRQRTPGYNPSAKYNQIKVLRYKEENVDPDQPLRLNKFMANAGICSRREADKYIEAGLVTVNGQVVTELGTKILRTDEVKFHDQPVSIEDKVYVLLNKPKDYVTTSDDPEKRKTVMDLVKNACPERIYPIGRLDRNTTGVLLLTNDGDIASKLMHPKFLKKKIYHVHLNRAVTEEDMKQILEGIELEDGVMKADAVEYASETDKKQVCIEIHSGKNRIVRRIFEHLGYRVVKLDRVYFAGLTKKNLRRGQWRFLTPKEVSMLRMGAFE